MNANLQQLLDQAVAENIVPGASAVIWRDGQLSSAVAGSLRGDGHQPVQLDTVYDVASITKSLPTAVLALQLVQTGKMQLHQTLSDLLPEYLGEGREAITLHQLLDFRLRWKLTASALKNLEAQELWTRILQAELAEPVPSTQRWYVNATSLLLGRIIEQHAGKDLASLARERLFVPCQLTHTSFSPPIAKVAPSEIDPWRGGEVLGEVHDESAWVLRTLFTPGSAGLFSTAPDLLKLLQEQLDQYDPNLAGLGWERQEPWMSAAASQSSFGKTGFTGCSVLWDPTVQVAAVLLSNYTYPQRPTHREPLTKLRQRFCYFALTGSLPGRDR